MKIEIIVASKHSCNPPLKIDNKRMIDALREKSEWLMLWGILPFVTLFKSMNELAFCHVASYICSDFSQHH